MKPHALIALIFGAVLSNLLVFSLLSVNLNQPSPRPPRIPHATYTANPELARRLLTLTPTASGTPTPSPTPHINGISDTRIELGNPHGPLP